MNTDKTWQWYGENDPYYGVLTEDSFRGGNLTLERKRAFFESGQKHISDLLRGLEETHMPIKKTKALDFGCGVGRLVIPLAQEFDAVVAWMFRTACSKNVRKMRRR